ncbi:YqaJ viral recombinase family protein, partial [Psychrobacter immobilis]
MNMIALNTSTPVRRTKRLSAKVTAPVTDKAKSENKRIDSSATQSFTPKRLVSTKDLSHDEWLEVRRQGVGSSDAAAACGIHPYLSMLELWLIKTGRASSDLD